MFCFYDNRSLKMSLETDIGYQMLIQKILERICNIRKKRHKTLLEDISYFFIQLSLNFKIDF